MFEPMNQLPWVLYGGLLLILELEFVVEIKFAFGYLHGAILSMLFEFLVFELNVVIIVEFCCICDLKNVDL